MADLEDLLNRGRQNLADKEPQYDMNSFVSEQQEQMQEQQRNPFFEFIEQKINPHARPIANDINAAAMGFMNSVGNAGSSAVNAGLSGINALGGPDLQIPEGDLSRLTSTESASFYTGGNIVGDIASSIGGYKALPSFAGKAEGVKRMLLEALQGATAGGLTNQYGYGGREGGALFGSIFPGAAKSTNTGAAKMLAKDARAIKNELGPMYETLLNKSGKVSIPKHSEALHDLLDKRILSKTEGAPQAIKDWFEKKTPKAAKDAISKLKTEQRNLLSKKYPVPSKLPGGKLRKYDLIGDAISDIEKQLDKGFNLGGHPLGLDELKALDKRYATEYGPYAFPELEAFASGKGSARGVMNAIKGMEDYPADVHRMLMKKYPELYINKYLFPHGAPTTAAVIGGGSLLTKSGIDLFKKYFSGEHE